MRAYYDRHDGSGGEARMLNEGHTYSQQAHLRTNQQSRSKLASKKAKVLGLAKPEQLDWRQGLNSAKNNHQ